MASPSISTHAALARFLPNYWDSVLGENLYPNLYLYQFGTKRVIPRNFGNTIKIPRLLKQNIVFKLTEGSIPGACPISGTTISGGMSQFGGVYKHADILMLTAMSDVVQMSLADLSRDAAKKIDNKIRDTISGLGLMIATASAGTSQTVHTADILKPKHIIRGVVNLDNTNNSRPADGHYPVIIAPKTVYDIQTNLSGGAWLDILKYSDSQKARIYQGEVGKMYGARFVTSTESVKRIATGLSTGVSGYREFMFAPDAYYVTEIGDLTAKTYVKQLGSAGSADPINQQSTVGVKVYFGCLAANWSATEYKLVRFIHGNTL